MFDHLLTIEENSKISGNLSKMEELNSKAQVNELKSAYVMIEDGTLCKVCRRKLKAKNIRVFPNGGVYH